MHIFGLNNDRSVLLHDFLVEKGWFENVIFSFTFKTIINNADNIFYVEFASLF
jgi:hypothetical protein